MTWSEARPSKVGLAALVARTAGRSLYDRVAARRVTDGHEVPPSIGAITPEWLTAVLGRRQPGATVGALSVDSLSAGTSERARLHLTYVGERGELPATMFAKTTPGVLNRLANVATGTSAAEAAFYAELRPALGDVEVPIGFYGAVDERRMRAMQLIEDLSAAKDATFGSPELRLDRAQADAVIDLLAHVHRTLRPVTDAAWLRTHREWWVDGLRIADVRPQVERFMRDDRCPPALQSRAAEIWPAFAASVEDHDRHPATVIHADVHVGNWYVTADGRPGLCDWQCISYGHPSLDLAYALVTLLTVEQRRDWEHDLLARYRLASGGPDSEEMLWWLYRRQLLGALLKWAPTLFPPPGLPEMQPEATSIALLERITTAMIDLDALGAFRAHVNGSGAPRPAI